jgi:ribosome-binding protein aMBF1 (putative translation factor)
MSTETQPAAIPSPIGERVGEGRLRRADNADYRAEQTRLAPFETVAQQVIMRRGELGLTQKELANKVGTSHSAISRLEGGQHRASIDTLQRVGGALGLRLIVSFEPVDSPQRTPIPA